MENLEKILALMEEDFTEEEKKMDKKEIETMTTDTILFLQLLPLFEKMSKRGKDVTIETLIMLLVKEE